MKQLKVLVGCENSQVVTAAFRDKGHLAYSNDILPTDGNSEWHLEGDTREYLNMGWDLFICHPPCTYLTVAGALWFYHPEDKNLPYIKRRPHPLYPDRRREQWEAAKFAKQLMAAPIEYICMENPVGALSTLYRKPDQIIHPWQFGHTTQKGTCLWLKNLPLLKHTCLIPKELRTDEIHKAPPGPDRWKIRSKTFQGIADAMADQWGDIKKLEAQKQLSLF
jgi:hypothetical protein